MPAVRACPKANIASCMHVPARQAKKLLAGKGEADKRFSRKQYLNGLQTPLQACQPRQDSHLNSLHRCLDRN